MSKLSEEMIKNLLQKHDDKSKNDVDISFDDIDKFGDTESMQQMFDGIKSYNRMLKQRITFINQDLTKVIPFTRENLYLICAYTGSGKTTLAANVSYPLWQQGKKVLILSNEESQQDVLYRIACLELALNFNDWKKGTMPISEQKQCLQLFPVISQFIKVVDVTYKNGFTSKVEGVKKALEQVQTSDYSCVLIDYFQEVRYSITDPKRSQYEVLSDLATFLKMYIKQSNIPVVLFAQLHSLNKRKIPELDGRIKMCPDILQAATVAIEVIPNFENKTTDLLIHKDRFGLTGKKVVCGFDKGKYVPYDDAFKQKVQSAKLAQLAAAVGHVVQKDDDV